MDGINELRNKLDGIDREIMRLFAERMECAEEIGRIKRTGGLPILDAEREKEVVSSRAESVPDGYRDGAERLARLLIDESKRTQKKGLNLYLIGMPDCGKTRMGKKLKELLSLPLLDTDKAVMESAGRTVDEIFAASGEKGFRSLESDVLRAVAEKGGMIVALGGGTPLFGDNASVIKHSGVTVFLDRKPEKLLGQNTVNRPLIRGTTPAETDEKILLLFNERHDKYSAAADLTVDPDEPGAAEAIKAFYLECMK
ncbi:MAG: chorismate mutase [Clostridia bacterium]|nr:chorismate mutase [Clostridia bacterium]